MATGGLDANGIWLYGEDDSEPTASALLNKLGSSVSNKFAGLSKTVLQVKYAPNLSTASTTSSTMSDLPGLSISITPTSSSSKFLVLADVGLGGSGGQLGQVVITRDSTQIYLVTFSNNTDTGAMHKGAGSVLDTPATTSPVTYKLRWANLGTGATYLNRRAVDATVLTTSSITVLEVAG